jgi:cytochrome oxidase Cu insertion factor (SCO1/SenC/PrrC family)
MLVVVLLLGALVAGGLYWKKQRETAQLGPPRQSRQLTEFRLTERSGRLVERAEFQGKILVANFVFTGCSLACYEVSRRMTEIQGYVASKPDVQLVSFSVDPRTDTPEVLSSFADRLKADSKRWLFLTGDKGEVYRVIETSFLPKAPLDAPSLIPGNFDRAERIVVVDRDGKVRRYFDGMSSSVVGQVLDEIAETEREGKR